MIRLDWKRQMLRLHHQRSCHRITLWCCDFAVPMSVSACLPIPSHVPLDSSSRWGPTSQLPCSSPGLLLVCSPVREWRRDLIAPHPYKATMDRRVGRRRMPDLVSLDLVEGWLHGLILLLHLTQPLLQGQQRLASCPAQSTQ